MTAATPTTAKIAAALANGETLTARDIAAVTGAGYSTVGKALNAMAAEGKVASVKQAFEDGGATLWMIASGDAAPAAEAELEAAEEPRANAEIPVPAPAPFGPAAAAREQAAAKPSQMDRITTALGMTEDELAADVVNTMNTVGHDLGAQGGVAERHGVTVTRWELNIGDLVTVHAHQRTRIARVWDLTPTKLSAVYVTPSEVESAARGNRRVSPNSITAKIAECGLVQSAANTDRPGPRTEAKAKAAVAKGSVADGTLAAMGRGDLRAAVLAYLTANRGEITPAKLAKALGGRSSGAVAKGLVKLVEAGQVVQTSDAPKTYRLA
jgi:hypothetical protein